jgi:hypothetical protein
MIGNNLPQLTGTKRSLLVFLASSALFTAGCSNMMSTATDSNLVSNAKSIKGKVHGGSQPVSGATVKLYYAGQNPTPPSEAATTTSAADGSFSFTNSGTSGLPENGNIYSCPSNTNPLVYVIAKGGNTLGDGNASESNSAAAFIGIYGDCNQLTSSDFIELNEVTTVATMLAVQQYFDPAGESLSADGIGAAKIAIDATPATIANMVNTGTGVALTSTNIPGIHGLAGATVTATPESSKINLLANIITSCVNNASASAPNCTSLFANAVPPNSFTTSRPGTAFGQATDVLQALYYMLTNPTSGGNIANLFALAGGTASAFQPALATQPSDWTVAISYSSTNTCGTGNGGLFSAPNALAIDLDGDVWIGNGQTNNGNTVEISSSGTAATCNSFGAGATTAPSAVFIDSAQNVWSALSGSLTLTRFNPNNSSSLTFSAAGPVLAIAGDGSGNIFFSVATAIYEIAGGATAGPTATTPTLVTSVATNATSLMPDKTGALWASSGTTALQQIVGTTVTTYTAGTNTQSLVVTGANTVFVSSVTPGNSISYFANVDSSGYLLQSNWPAVSPLGGINQPTAITVDGVGNVWSANLLPNTNPAFANDPTAPPTLFGISEISVAGNPLSPDTASGGFQKSASYLNASSSIIVDQSGNVWVAGGAAGNNFITEIVGAGVPIFQPYAVGLTNGGARFQGKP